MKLEVINTNDLADKRKVVLTRARRTRAALATPGLICQMRRIGLTALHLLLLLLLMMILMRWQR